MNTFEQHAGARNDIREDEETRRLWTAFRQKQNECRSKQLNGEMTRQDLQKIRSLGQKRHIQPLFLSSRKLP